MLGASLHNDERGRYTLPVLGPRRAVDSDQLTKIHLPGVGHATPPNPRSQLRILRTFLGPPSRTSPSCRGRLVTPVASVSSTAATRRPPRRRGPPWGKDERRWGSRAGPVGQLPEERRRRRPTCRADADDDRLPSCVACGWSPGGRGGFTETSPAAPRLHPRHPSIHPTRPECHRHTAAARAPHPDARPVVHGRAPSYGYSTVLVQYCPAL